MYDDLKIEVPAQEPEEVPCKIALVGEAPGEEEIERFRPFVGPAGRMLNSMLRHAGIAREHCLVTNVYDTKLLNNSLAEHRAMLGGEWDGFHRAAVERLSAELLRVHPTVIVPLGGTALSVLAGQGSKISAYRGHPTPACPPFSPKKLVPALHPAAVIRDYRMYVPTIGDLLRAAAEADAGPEIRRPKRELWLDPTIEEVEEFCYTRCMDTSLISCDIETGWGLFRGFSFAPSAEIGIYIPFIDLRKPTKSYWDTPELEFRAWKAVKWVLECPIPKLGQNFSSYDITWIAEKLGFRVMNFTHELRLLHKSLYPELPASLEFMAGAYSQQGAWKAFAEHGGKKANRSAKRDQ